MALTQTTIDRLHDSIRVFHVAEVEFREAGTNEDRAERAEDYMNALVHHREVVDDAIAEMD